MRKVLVTGASGFIGKSLVLAMGRIEGIEVSESDIDTPAGVLSRALFNCDAVFHLAGVNRPKDMDEFEKGNVGSLEFLLAELEDKKKKPLVVLASSRQAVLDNPYGRSKLKAERLLLDFARRTGTLVRIFRLPGVFGKWCRPNYNSVVATFCYNIAHGLPIVIADPAVELDLVHIDDVIMSFLEILNGHGRVDPDGFNLVDPVFNITVGQLAHLIKDFHESRQELTVPDFSDHFTRCLFSTYVSYLPTDNFAYALKQHADSRGVLAEIFKSGCFGQIFISRTAAGAIRGDHYHDTKVEKFFVLEGEALIRFRDIQCDDVIEYKISGEEFRVIDIPPGYTHNIKNIGSTALVVLFWAFEPFDPRREDTFPLPVRKDKQP